MTEMPDDLQTLPTMPYDKRPDALPLDIEECRTALWICRGNVSRAASLLKVEPSRLRRFVAASPRLTEEQKEAQQQLVDIAEDVAYEALTDDADPGRRDQMARYVMTNLGRTRGYGNVMGGVNINLPKGNFNIQWADGSSLSAESEANGDAGKVIEHG